MSIEALAMLGVDYRKVEVQAVLNDPWFPDPTEINDNILQQWTETSEALDHRPHENGMREKELKSAKKAPFPSSELVPNGDILHTADDDDADKLMKIKLRQWARAVASYVIMLDKAFKYSSAGVT